MGDLYWREIVIATIMYIFSHNPCVIWWSHLQDHEFRLIARQSVLLQNQFKPGLIELGLITVICLRRVWGGEEQRGNKGRKVGKKNEGR